MQIYSSGSRGLPAKELDRIIPMPWFESKYLRQKERYRSGYNGTDLKSVVSCKWRLGSNPSLSANKENKMTKEEQKLLNLKSRLRKIEMRGKYLDAPGVYKKVLRQIKKFENERV